MIENDFVDTGLVDASVLDLEKPAEQFSMIAESMLEQKNMIEVSNQKNEELSGTISDLKQQNADLSSQLSSLPSVNYSTPTLTVKGEDIDTTLKD